MNKILPTSTRRVTIPGEDLSAESLRPTFPPQTVAEHSFGSKAFAEPFGGPGLFAGWGPRL